MAANDKLPKFADWVVTAGGIQSHESQDGYHVRGPFGEYHLWPIAGYGGRKRGSYYIVQFANTPHFDPDQHGLWRDLGRASSPRKAYAIAKAHHEIIRARRAGRTSNPRRRNPELREVVSDFAGVRRQWAMQKMPEGVRGYIVELEHPRRGRYSRIKFEGKVWLGTRELANASGASLRGVFQDLMYDMESALRAQNPIRSKAQWRALAAKTRRGEISKRQWREMVRETKRGYRRLPERVGRRAGKRRTARRRNPPRSYAGWSEKQLYARLNKLIDQHQRNLESVEYGDAIFYDATPIMREMEGIDRVLRNRRAFARDQRRKRR